MIDIARGTTLRIVESTWWTTKSVILIMHLMQSQYFDTTGPNVQHALYVIVKNCSSVAFERNNSEILSNQTATEVYR